MPLDDSADPVVRQIHTWKEALIDLSRRNPLLSLSLKAKSNLLLTSGPDELYTYIARRRKALLFVPEVPELQSPLFDEPRPQKPGLVYLPPAEYKVLNTLRQRSALALHEQGINTLFIAVGLLEWPDLRTRTTLLSPLLLVPVSLERIRGDDSLRLRRLEDEVELNPTLQYRLSQKDLALELPELPDEDELVASAYLQVVADAFQGRAGWTVHRQCYIGRFSFLKLVMYRDLDALAGAARKHPLVAALAGDRTALRRLPAITVPELHTLDAATRGQEMFQVRDADPTQLRAILAAREGQSFVLQGPPGTGKTQTIANIITECIAAGKRVLFVSQKMAALDAVFKRLRDRGLADLCLEAHSHKANKKDVLAQLDKSLKARVRPERRNAVLSSELVEVRDGLNAVAAELHQVRQPLGLSLYEAHGRVALAEDVPDLPFVFIGAELIGDEEYRRLEGLAERLASYQPLFRETATHPWRGVLKNRFSLNLQTEVRTLFGDLRIAAEALERSAGLLAAACGIPEPIGVSGTDKLLELAALATETPRPPAAWLVAGMSEELSHEARECRRRYAEFTSRRQALLAVYDAGALTLPHADLRERLLGRHEVLLGPAFGEAWRDKAVRSGAELLGVLDAVGSRGARLSRSLAALAVLCGVPCVDTIAFGRYLLRVAGRACTDPKPQPGWFEPGAITGLVRRGDEAQAHHEAYASNQGNLMDRYSDRVFGLDLEGLSAHFSGEYNGFLKYFKPGFYRDRSVIRAALRPGAGAPADFTDDLRLALEVQQHQSWIREHETELEAIYGRHYRGLETNWDVLRSSLRQVEALAAAFSGQRVPDTLRERLVSSGPEVEALADARLQAEEHFTTFGKDVQSLQTWRGGAELPFTDKPFAQAPLDEFRRWAISVQGALTDHLEARGAALALRLTAPMTAPTAPLMAVSTAAELAADLETASWVAREAETLREEGEALRSRYAGFYQDLNTDWEAVLAALAWVDRLQSLLPEGPVPSALASLVTEADPAKLADLAAERITAADWRGRAAPLLIRLETLFPPERLQAAGHTLMAAPYPALADWLQVRLERLSDLERWIDYQNLREDCAETGLLSFFDTTAHRVPKAEQVVPAFRKRFYRLWLDAVTDTVLPLRQFRGEGHSASIARFAGLDLSQIDTAPARVQSLAHARKPTALSGLGELGALRTQLARKRPKPIRKLLADIPNVLFALKPCLLMSPLSVSLFLDPEVIHVDMVIFDEASQIFVQDAIAALLRGTQAVIAGDTKQLPPTSFFLNLQEEGDEQDDEDEPAPSAAEFESVLKAADALAADGSPHFAQHPLEWHYRSHHESLIAFSRRHFYDRLTTFPSATREPAVTFEHVADGVYYGGKGGPRNNPVEARRVADLVEAHVRAKPEQSLGVITFSQAQQKAIQEELDARIRADPSLEPLLSEEGAEGFFVKNIENVQGDERDIIYLSVGYARDSYGKVANRFGPLNLEGGERRLNVAVSRAKEHCTVISSLLPQDITSDRTGPRLLRAYMEFARGGVVTAADLLGVAAPEQGDFERAVEGALRGLGHEVQRQVGFFDYRVDLAVLDPGDPNRFLLGVECCGPGYAEAETARARDRLRPQVLRDLGWRMVRLWSADWVRDPDGQRRRLEEALARAIRGEDLAPQVTLVTAQADLPAPAATGGSAITGGSGENGISAFTGLPPGVSHFVRAQLALPGASEALYEDDNVRRIEFLFRLVEQEGPLPLEAVAQRMAEAAGLSRTGSRVRVIIEDTVDDMARIELVIRRGEFLWPKYCDQPPPRVPRPGDVPRPIEHISLEEIGELVVALLKVAFGMRRDEVILETARLLGYRNTGVNIRDRINEALSLLELDTRIHVQGGQVRALEL